MLSTRVTNLEESVAFTSPGSRDIVLPLGPIQYLAMKTGINERRVAALCNGEVPYVPVGQGDKILAAARLNHLSDGRLNVIPNPNWSLQKWVRYMSDQGCYEW